MNLYPFFAKAIALYLFWLLATHLWLYQPNNLNDQIVVATGKAVESIFKKIGYESGCQWIMLQTSDVYLPDTREALAISIDGKNTVAIGSGCSGLDLMALYLGFLIAYPGTIKPKLIFAAVGVLAIFIANVARITALAFHIASSYETFEINHKYSYNFLLYSIVFVLWMVWVQRYSSASKANLEAY